MTIESFIDKLINPDFKCFIKKQPKDAFHHSSFSYYGAYVSYTSIGGIEECLDSIYKEVTTDHSYYTFPVTIQMYDKVTGKILWNGRIAKEPDSY
ncbi:hypothetical protein [Aquimarina sp. I32.4]|uniref:hypothetical protein n=1 Tax=Aquimarina sp. I32.4 TaxID=2053903 RepID=UPI0011AF66CA|nr:hypothetical protein [Aquimarina sp. I32.4]